MRLLLLLALLLPVAHAAQLADLTRNTGQYAFDVKLFQKPVFKARVQALITPGLYELLQKNLTVSGPIMSDQNRTVYYLTGNAPHLGGSEAAILAYDVKRDALVVMIQSKGRYMSFEEGRFMDPRAYPEDLQRAIINFYGGSVPRLR
ncbi:hypothetical protein GO986_18045 [Deinococcus sp. HMF7620]|uniref:Uncharacterized protein n=1 Tax=Deinococcus arboris TaxID=2682977 RepID=A0A7C9LT09_9DEIO|nr:hypothetical protein [Deinococcus arboris]MVN88641.1 hypothetical protein [Deinococcus arboris]